MGLRTHWRKMTYVGAAVVGATLLAGCSSPATPESVPNVTGQNLDQAEGTLSSDGLTYNVYGGGAFGIVIKSDWTVCSENPSSGKATSVKLVVARESQGTAGTHRESPCFVWDFCL